MTFLTRSLSIFIVLAGLLLVGRSAEAVKPLAPLEMTLELGGTPQVGGEVPVVLKIRSMMDAPLVKIRCTFPKGVEKVSGQDTWEGELTAGSLKEITFILKVKEPGEHLIRAMATIEYPGGGKISKGAALRIDLETETKEKVKPDKKGPIIRKGKDGQDIGEFPLD